MLLTIVSVTKDDFEGIQKTIQSTRELRKNPLVEQLVIDSSNSETASRMQEFLASEQGVRYFYQPPEGISQAFNLGLCEALGQWFWCLNGGDELHNNCPLPLFESLMQNSLADALIFEMESIKGISQRPAFFTLWPPVFNWVPHPATLVKTTTLATLGGFREDFKIAMDVELWLRLLASDARIDMISIPLSRFAPGGLSSQTPKTAAEIRKAMWLHKKLLFQCFFESGHKVYRAWRHFGRRARGK